MRPSNPIPVAIPPARLVYQARTLRTVKLPTAASVRRTCSLHSARARVCFKFKYLKECVILTSLFIYLNTYTHTFIKPACSLSFRKFVYKMHAGTCMVLKTPETVSSASTFSAHTFALRAAYSFFSFSFLPSFFFFSHDFEPRD